MDSGRDERCVDRDRGIEQVREANAMRFLLRQLQRLGTVPPDADNGDEPVRQNASHSRGGRKGFEPRHFLVRLKNQPSHLRK